MAKGERDSEDEDEVDYEIDDEIDQELEDERQKNIKANSPKVHDPRSSVDITDLMLLWILALLFAVGIRIIETLTTLMPSGSQLYSLLIQFSDFLLQFPGIMAPPLVVGIMMGSEIGARSDSLPSALRSGLMNGLYAAIIYLIAIILIYTLMSYTTPQFTTLYLTVLNDIVLPIAALLLTVEVISALAYLRKVDN